MNRDEFYKQYMCEFKPDPMLEAAIEFLKTASREHIAQVRRDGWLTNDLRRAALRFLEDAEDECIAVDRLANITPDTVFKSFEEVFKDVK